jgi:endonuclease/exonuclease/phosphatase family metal-dependent hydrolase
MTYNVHRCVGVDGRLDVARIAAVIAQARPDIVALQELDVRRARTGGVDQAHALAHRLGMSFHFHAALQVAEEGYGDAILAAAPLTVIKAGPLPGLSSIKALEPRGALWLALDLGGRPLQVLNTHLGLVPHEQRAQARALVGPEWIGARAPGDPPLILLGDLNATPPSVVYRTFVRALTDARGPAPGGFRGATPTFPSRLPLLAIDHVFLDGPIAAIHAQTSTAPLARVASDHLPLIVDFEFR